MENKMINWINNYIDKLRKEGKKETLKKIDLKEIGCPRGIHFTMEGML